MGFFDFIKKLGQDPTRSPVEMTPEEISMLNSGEAEELQFDGPIQDALPPPQVQGSIPSPGQLAKGAAGLLGGAGLAVGAGSALNSFVNPFAKSAPEAGDPPISPSQNQRLDLVEKGLLPGSAADHQKIRAMDQKALHETVNPAEGQSPKDHIAGLAKVDPGSPNVLSKIFEGIKEAPPVAQSALHQTLKETLGVSIADISSRKDLKFMDEMLNKSQEVQAGRESNRVHIDERTRQLRQKVSNPESMSKGEMAAFMLAAGIPIIAAAISKRQLNPAGLQQLGALAQSREGQIAAGNRQDAADLQSAEKQLDSFDARSINIFSQMSSQAANRANVRGKEQDMIGKALSNVKEFEKSGKMSTANGIMNVKTSAPERKSASTALNMSQSNSILNKLESQFSAELSDSFTRLYGSIDDYLPLVGNVIKVQLPQEQIPQEFQRYLNARATYSNAILREESGAAISIAEVAEEINRSFVNPGDSPELIAQKQDLRRGRISKVEALSSPAAMSQARMVFAEGLVKEPISQAGGRIETRVDPAGNIVKYVMIPDPETGKMQVAPLEKFAESLMQNGVFEGDKQSELERNLKGL